MASFYLSDSEWKQGEELTFESFGQEKVMKDHVKFFKKDKIFSFETVSNPDAIMFKSSVIATPILFIPKSKATIFDTFQS